MEAEQTSITTADGTALAVSRWPGDGPAVVLLHAGVADRRSWTAVADELRGTADRATSDSAGSDLVASDRAAFDVVAYDRRGFGDSPASDRDFTHLDDLVAVLDGLGIERAFLVGNSMGGALALDAASTRPERVAGVLLVGAAVSGMTDEDTPFDWAPDPASAPLLEVAEGDGDPEAKLRALAHLWLDGPDAPEGRVDGAPRDLFVAMNRRIDELGAPDGAGDAGLDTWAHLDAVRVPVLATWGSLDIPADVPFYAETARRIGCASRVLPDVAHLPGLERPALVADLVREVAQPVT